jgi:hypothetical protein
MPARMKTLRTPEQIETRRLAHLARCKARNDALSPEEKKARNSKVYARMKERKHEQASGLARIRRDQTRISEQLAALHILERTTIQKHIRELQQQIKALQHRLKELPAAPPE